MLFLTEGNHVFSWEFSRIKLYAVVERALTRMAAQAVPARRPDMPRQIKESVMPDTVLG
jgi:hypothetical protein